MSKAKPLPETQQGRPTWQAALLVFLVLAVPTFLILSAVDILARL